MSCSLKTEWYDYGARMYDPVIGKWNALDPVSEKYPSWSPYNYCINNPIIIKDIDGADGVIVIRGYASTDAIKHGAISTHRGNYPMYRMDFYNDMNVIDYQRMTDNGRLYLRPNSTMLIARDAWGDPEDLGLEGERSSKRYGKFNEAPPGIYYLEYNENGYGESKKRHFLSITSEKGNDYILGPDGKRYSIHLHEWSPHDAVGCPTLGTDGNDSENKALTIVDLMTDLLNPLEDVNIIIEERERIHLVQTGTGYYTFMNDAQLKAWNDLWERERKKIEEQINNR